MTQDQAVILGIGTVTIGMFLWGRWRHDMVAVAALLLCVVAGLVPGMDAFAGFGHPAVITVACVLILSRGLQTTGVVDVLAQRVLPAAAGPTLTIAALTALAAILSAFMNNVGALALLMPVAIQIADRQQLPAGKVLMPLAFGSILGGMTTLIGTPPNLIVSAFRADLDAGGFGMFDFTPVGLAVASAGVLFVALVGWRIVPTRETAEAGGFDTGAYLTEVRVSAKSKAAGASLRDLESRFEAADAQVVGLVRHDVRLSTPGPGRVLRAGDILVIEAEPESLSTLLTSLGLTLEEDVRGEPDGAADDGGAPATREEEAPEAEASAKTPESDEVVLSEVAVRPDSGFIDRSASDLLLRTRFNINLLAIARQGHRSIRRLRSTPIQAGDVLLLQGAPEALAAFAVQFGCVPLAPRAIQIPDTGKAVVATLVMVAAIGIAALGLLPAAIAFAAGALVFMAWRIVPPRLVYEAVDWPVVVLLGALIPVAGAMSTTGAADLLAGLMLSATGATSPIVSLTVVLVVTMVLSDFMNNAATAAVMCPIALSAAAQIGANADPFLMAVAVGASCAFLTPIGHQNNTLILGPGGFRFGDYWRLGLLLEVIVVVVGVPMLVWAWPL
ncbi:MAG: SLC13 family permease [Vicinamibacterales bacterium]|nr:SLC13 family permease [Vicinamibacterales bacterium]